MSRRAHGRRSRHPMTNHWRAALVQQQHAARAGSRGRTGDTWPQAVMSSWASRPAPNARTEGLMAHVVADTWSPVGGAGSARKSPPVATLTKAESPEQRGPHAFLEDLLSSCNPGFREMARRQLQGLTSDGGTISKSAKHAYSPEALAFLVEQRLYDPNPALREQARRILMEVAA